MRTRLRYVSSASGVAVVATVVAVTVGFAPASAKVTHHASASAKVTHRAAKVTHRTSPKRLQPALLRHYAVLARARATVDVQSDTQLVNPRQAALLQLNVADTQLVETGTGPVWIIPGNNGACVFWGQTAATTVPEAGANYVGCGETSTILSEGLTVHAHSSEDGSFVFGIVPNGNSSVTVTSAGGVSNAIPVVDNAFAGKVPAGDTTLGFTDAAGTAHTISFTGVR